MRLTAILIFFQLSVAGYSQPDHATDSLSALLNKANQDTVRINLLNKLASRYLKSDTAKTLDFIGKALSLSAKTGYATGLADSYHKYGDYYIYIDRYENSIANYDKAIAIYKKCLTPESGSNENKRLQNSIAQCYRGAGMSFYYSSNYAQAIEYLNKSLELLVQGGDLPTLAECYNDLGLANFRLGQIPEALSNHDKALNLRIRLNNRRGMAQSYGNLANIYHAQGDYVKALDLLQKAIKIYDATGEKSGSAMCYMQIGMVHERQQSLSLALQNYETSQKMYEELQDKKGISDCCILIAILKDMGQDYNGAIANYEKALRIKEETGEMYGVAACLGNLGIAYMKLGNYPKALEYMEKTIEINQKIGDKTGIATSYLNMGSVYISLKKISEAIECFNKSLVIAKEIKALDIEKDIYEGMSRAYEKKGNTAEAFRYFKLFKNTGDSLFSLKKNEQLTEMQTRYESEKKEKEIQLLNNQNRLKTETIARQDAENKKQRVLIFSFVTGFIIIVVFALIISRLFLQKKKANRMLAEQNAEIRQQKEEITSQRDEIASQRDEIEAQRDEITAQRDMVTDQKDKIESIHHELMDSIRYAKRIQNAVLPGKELADQLFKEYFILFKPRDVVSGDFYWFSIRKNWLLAAVADCTGHGVPGAFMSMLGVTFLNEIVVRDDINTASAVLDEMRNYIIKSLQQRGIEGEQKDGMDMAFVAIDLLTSNDPSGNEIFTLQYAGANNPLYIVTGQQSLVNSTKSPMIHEPVNNDVKEIKADMSAETNAPNLKPALLEVKADKMPIAIHENLAGFTNRAIEVRSGDTIYLATDGYEDQFGGPVTGGKKFLVKKFRALLSAHAHKPLHEQKEILDNTIEDWRQGHAVKFEQTDDITVVGIRL